MGAQSIQQKKLQTLQKQLYGGSGKSQPTTDYRLPTKSQNTNNLFSLDQVTIKASIKKSATEDTIYLKKDLTKVAILSTIILGFQFFIFYAIQVNILPKWI